MIRYPNITGKNDAQKLDQMKSYLHQLADELNYQLDKTGNIGSGYLPSSVEAGAVAKPVKKDDAISNFNEIKGLIIKSADIVDAYSEQISETLRGEYVAVSDFSTYKEETQAQLTASSDKIKVVLEKQEEIETNLDDPESEFRREISSEIQQTADSINLKVVNDTEGKMAGIQLTVGEKDSGQIDMTGLVTFSNLSTPNDKTVINGSNITTGQILADLIKAGVIKSKDGESVVIDLDKGEGTFTGKFNTTTEYEDLDSGEKTQYKASLNSRNVTVERRDLDFNSEFLDLSETYITPANILLHSHSGGTSTTISLDKISLSKAGGTSIEAKIEKDRAYIKGLTAPIDASDAVNKAYVDGNFASKDINISKYLSTAGWYKVGTVRALDQYCGSLRIVTDGSYYYNEPIGAVIDVVFGYNQANAKTVVPAASGNGGIRKVALVRESGSVYGVYVYYNVNNQNAASLKIREMGSIFTPINFEAAANFNEASASTIADVYSASYAPNGYGLGIDYRIVYTSAELDSLIGSGYFATVVGVVDAYTGWWGHQIAQDDRFITQKVFTYNGTSKERTMWDGVWQPWEWVNPPLSTTEEYRTTERFQGRPVFVKYVELDGQLPVAGATKYIPHGINMEYPIDWYGVYANQQAFVPNTNFDGITLTGTYVIVISDPQSGNPEAKTLRLVIKYLKPGI